MSSLDVNESNRRKPEHKTYGGSYFEQREKASALPDAIERIKNGREGFTADDVELAVRAEREACAKIADVVLNHQGEFDSYRHGYRDAAMAIEKRILARSNTVRKEATEVTILPLFQRGEAIQLPAEATDMQSFRAGIDAAERRYQELMRSQIEPPHPATYYPPVIAPLGHLQGEEVWNPGDSVGSGNWIVVGELRYGIDEHGLYRFRNDASTYDRTEAEKFAAPVARYIKDHGWDWIATTIEQFGENVKFTYGNDVLWFLPYAGAWSCPATDGKTGFEHLHLEQNDNS